MNIGENEGRIFLDDVVPDKSKRILTGDRFGKTWQKKAT